jgi:sarcosine oxidase gamma subunit
MAKISEQLADLSVRAKHAEDAVTAAQKEAHDKVLVRREQARNAAAAAIEKVDRNIKTAGDGLKSVGDAAAGKWTALQTKIAGDLESMKSGIAEKKHDWDARRAESQADRLEWEAGLAIDYAIATVEQAELAVLDAVAGRQEAAQAQRA